jgi:hypothetical protein
MTLSEEAVLRFPARYLGHVGAHYYGLWSYALMVPLTVNQIAASQRQYAAESQQNMDQGWIPKPWQASSARIVALKESAAVVEGRSLFFSDVQTILGTMFGTTIATKLATTIAALIGLGATIAALGIFILPRLPRDIAAPVIAAGFVVPYLAINSLFQVALLRYTATAELGIAALMTLAGFALISRFWSWLSGFSQRRTISSTSRETCGPCSIPSHHETSVSES